MKTIEWYPQVSGAAMKAGRGLVVVLLLALVVGCATQFPGSSLVPGSKGTFGAEQRARKEVVEAREFLESGDTSTAVPRLLNVVSNYPNTKAAVEARYYLGQAYYQVDGFKDAIDSFSEYLKLAPEGEFAAPAQEYVAKISEQYSQKFPSPEQLDKEVDAYKGLVEAYPADLGNKLKLADLLWRRGNYEEAGVLYGSIVQQDGAYKNDETITRRIEWLPTGKYILLTPTEIQRRQAEDQPLAIINTNTFRVGEDLFTREARDYSVTGQVVNRGDSVLYGIEVTVTIFGVGNVVFDTTTVHVRRLNPGEIRAFTVRFSNIDNVENVHRYECTATFER